MSHLEGNASTCRRMLLSCLLAGFAAGAAAQGPSGAPASWPSAIHDSRPYGKAMVDRFERGLRSGSDIDVWDAQAWWGTDRDRLWLRTEGEAAAGGRVERAEVQALYSRPVASFWDLQAGLRYSQRPDPSRTDLVLGIEGFAPYRFETTAALFVSERGDARLRAEFEYDFLITQRLILQPRFEARASAQDVPELGIGSGVTGTELGLRLRYEIRREFAPYLGVSWGRSWGGTADRQHAAGEPISTTSLVLGLRAWF